MMRKIMYKSNVHNPTVKSANVSSMLNNIVLTSPRGSQTQK